MKKFVFIGLTLIFASSAFAQAPNSIPSEKKKLIAELITLTKTDKQIGEVTEVILKSMETNFLAGFERSVDNGKNLTPEEKEKLKSSVAKNFQAFSKKFRERLPQAINYSQYVEETVYPLYDKFYTEQELRDLASFYKTPTGQKVVDTMPQLYAESSRLAQQNLMPKVLKLLDEIMKEELGSVGQPPPPAKKPNR